MFALFLGCCWW